MLPLLFKASTAAVILDRLEADFTCLPYNQTTEQCFPQADSSNHPQHIKIVQPVVRIRPTDRCPV